MSRLKKKIITWLLNICINFLYFIQDFWNILCYKKLFTFTKKNCMILLRWSTSYVEIILWRQQTYDWATLKCIIIIIIFKIINKSYFLCIHDVTGCGYRPSHRHTFIITFMNFPRFIFSEFGPWRSLYSVFVWSREWLAAQSRVKVTYTGR